MKQFSYSTTKPLPPQFLVLVYIFEVSIYNIFMRNLYAILIFLGFLIGLWGLLYLAVYGFGGSYEQTKYITAIIFYGLISLFIFFFPLFLIILYIKDAKKNKHVKQNPDKIKSDWIIGIAMLLHLALVTYICYTIFGNDNFNDIDRRKIIESLSRPGSILWTGESLVFGTFIIGLSYYAKSKGQSGWLAILGLFGLIGDIMLILIPNKKKSKK